MHTKEKGGKSCEIPNKEVKIIHVYCPMVYLPSTQRPSLLTQTFSPDHITHCPSYQSSVRFEGGYSLPYALLRLCIPSILNSPIKNNRINPGTLVTIPSHDTVQWYDHARKFLITNHERPLIGVPVPHAVPSEKTEIFRRE